MRRNPSSSFQDAFGLIESATQQFRLASLGTHFAYYVGTLPFILFLLYFQADMSLNPFAASRLTTASLLLSLVFFWMKCWQSVFVRRIEAQLGRAPNDTPSFRTHLRLVILQIMLQWSGLFLIPIAALTFFPFAWVYAFYQNALACRLEPSIRVMAAMKHAWRQAAWNPLQNHIVLFVYSIFGLFVLVNIGAVILLIPLFMKKFMNIETRFSMNLFTMFNTTFAFTICGLAYLCLDPLLKITYALRGFHCDSVKSGEDIKADFKWYASAAGIIGGIVLLFLADLVDPSRLSAADGNSGVASRPPLSAETLDRSIESVMSRPEFIWRLPREKNPDPKPKSGFIQDILNWLNDQMEAIGAKMDAIRRFIDWLQSLFPEMGPSEKKKGTPWSLDPNLLMTIFCLILGIGLIFWLVRKYRRRRNPADDRVENTVRIMPDLSDENLRADALPSDEWLSLAKSLIETGDYRMALRAVYLATLSFLGERALISPARYKSNLDYNQELIRRAHDRKDLLLLFKNNLRFFEDVWYGMRAVQSTDIDNFRNNHEKMVDMAK